MKKREGAAFISKLTGLPADAAGHVPRITIIGSTQILIQYPGRLEQFTEQDVRIQLSESTLHIKGKSLEVKELMPEEIIVEGTMTNIQVEMKQGHRFG
jgi:sporulation protein YqfC